MENNSPSKRILERNKKLKSNRAMIKYDIRLPVPPYIDPINDTAVAHDQLTAILNYLMRICPLESEKVFNELYHKYGKENLESFAIEVERF